MIFPVFLDFVRLLESMEEERQRLLQETYEIKKNREYHNDAENRASLKSRWRYSGGKELGFDDGIAR
jgi:hypothetical protein